MGKAHKRQTVFGCDRPHLEDSMATSSQFVCLEDFRVEALKRLPSEFADYLEGGSGYEHTLSENRKAYNRSV